MAKKNEVNAWTKNVGKKVKFLGPQAGKPMSNLGGVPVGSEVKIGSLRVGSATEQYNVTSLTGGNIGWAYGWELSLAPETLADMEATIDDRKEQIKEIAGEISDLEGKIKFMKDQNIDTLDADGYRAYKILKVLKLGNYVQALEIVKILGES
jgi:hypothetical protein